MSAVPAALALTRYQHTSQKVNELNLSTPGSLASPYYGRALRHRVEGQPNRSHKSTQDQRGRQSIKFHVLIRNNSTGTREGRPRAGEKEEAEEPRGPEEGEGTLSSARSSAHAHGPPVPAQAAAPATPAPSRGLHAHPSLLRPRRRFAHPAPPPPPTLAT